MGKGKDSTDAVSSPTSSQLQAHNKKNVTSSSNLDNELKDWRPTTSVVVADELTCRDGQDDSIFYAFPRFVQHVDDSFKRRLADLYRSVIPAGSDVLDLCASWDSHLPADLRLHSVIGHGMNEGELRANSRLTHHFVQDLNTNPSLQQIETASVDAVLCCNGFQYLRRPLHVWREVERVLRPSGIVVVSFSSHVFAEKAFVGWLERDMCQRALLVSKCLEAAGLAVCEHTLTEVPEDPLSVSDSINEDTLRRCRKHAHQDRPREDPFCAIVAKKRSSLPEALREGGALRLSSLETNRDLVRDDPTWTPRMSDGMRALNETGHVSLAALALEEIEFFEHDENICDHTIERWSASYAELAREASSMGIPTAAIPELPKGSRAQEIRVAREHLMRVMASFASSQL